MCLSFCYSFCYFLFPPLGGGLGLIGSGVLGRRGLFRLRFRAADKVGDAHQAAFSGGLDFGGEVLAGDALAFSRPEVEGSLAGEVERQGLELLVSDLDHGCSPLRLNGSLLCFSKNC